ncbi:hypothetical protein PVNG_02430 [Plasmodium vivax North Korean]|uniref:Aspartyl/Glutamyl-tRNA(Gln) amidotransferase subunit B/E catalytic domain-containing protein n=1 Tax=Plasmodium vivax North Korean TaxID=1035514 RepID=A0A0J9TNG3_PLAVI|nr:hypothetical protein PVNG_02430 [Plasmodium vivax North Korean]
MDTNDFLHEQYFLKIGLEIHVELPIKNKSFSLEKREGVSITSLGYLGTLPQVNTEAIRMGLRVARALNSKLASEVTFERKAYLYFDLPRGYQISQYLNPIGRNGYIFLPQTLKKIPIRSVVIEEDTAAHSGESEGYTISTKRLGVPLIEIVTEPVFKSSEEAVECAK